MIKNISDNGGMLLFGSPEKVPERFVLRLSEDGRVAPLGARAAGDAERLRDEDCLKSDTELLCLGEYKPERPTARSEPNSII